MSRYHFELVIERLFAKPEIPGDRVFIPAAAFLGVLGVFLATDQFKPLFGIPAQVWQAFMLFVLAGTGLATLILAIAWFAQRKPKKPVKQIVDEVIAEMDREEAAGL